MITKQPSDVMVDALEHVIFTCKAKGFGVKYEWRHYNSESVIGMPQAIPSDTDQYYCVAMTEGGYAFSNNVTLTVDGEIHQK